MPPLTLTAPHFPRSSKTLPIDVWGASCASSRDTTHHQYLVHSTTRGTKSFLVYEGCLVHHIAMPPPHLVSFMLKHIKSLLMYEDCHMHHLTMPSSTFSPFRAKGIKDPSSVKGCHVHVHESLSTILMPIYLHSDHVVATYLSSLVMARTRGRSHGGNSKFIGHSSKPNNIEKRMKLHQPARHCSYLSFIACSRWQGHQRSRHKTTRTGTRNYARALVETQSCSAIEPTKTPYWGKVTMT